MSRLTDTSFESAMENLDAFDLIEWQGEIYNKLAEYERLGSVDYFKYCKNIEKSDLSHELEVYKRALMNSVPANFYEFEVSTKEEYIEIELDQARKELEDGR